MANMGHNNLNSKLVSPIFLDIVACSCVWFVSLFPMMLGGFDSSGVTRWHGRWKIEPCDTFCEGPISWISSILLIPDLNLVLARLVDYTRFQVYCALANMHVDMCVTVCRWMIATDHRLCPLIIDCFHSRVDHRFGVFIYCLFRMMIAMLIWSSVYCIGINDRGCVLFTNGFCEQCHSEVWDLGHCWAGEVS